MIFFFKSIQIVQPHCAVIVLNKTLVLSHTMNKVEIQVTKISFFTLMFIMFPSYLLFLRSNLSEQMTTVSMGLPAQGFYGKFYLFGLEVISLYFCNRHRDKYRRDLASYLWRICFLFCFVSFLKKNISKDVAANLADVSLACIDTSF